MRSVPNFPLFMLFLVFVASYTFAQSTYQTLTGRVLSQENGQPIPYAGVAILGRSVSTVSNAQGEFVLKIPAEYARDSVKVSCVGFQAQTQLLASVMRAKWGVRLKPAEVQLAEVRVLARQKSATDILRAAVAAIPRNYDTTSRQLTAFYREDQRFDNQPVVFSEAILSVYKAAYNQTELKDHLKVIKGRKKEYDRANHHLPPFINLSNGARTLLQYGDWVKLASLKENIINERNFKYYEFKLSVLTGDRMTYVIDFKPGKKQRRAYGKGRIYIDAETLAFVRAESQATQAGLDRENNRDWLLKKVASAIQKLNLTFTGFDEVVTFSSHPVAGGGQRWHLSNVERHYYCRVNSPKRNLIDKEWKVASSFTVTEVGLAGIQPFTEGDIAENQNPMSNIVGDQDDPNFWENYNIQQGLSADTVGLKTEPVPPTLKRDSVSRRIPNRQNGFTRADTLRGKLTPLRTSYDVLFYDLAVKVDIDRKAISGSNRMRFRVLAPVDKIQVDLYANMTIQQIQYRGKPLPYTREYDAVFVQFPEKLTPGSTQELEFVYAGVPQVPDFKVPMMGGFLWDKDRDGNPWVQVVCQGSGASLWWPNKDHLSDKPDSMRICVTVPGDLTEISNGRLRRKTTLPGNWTEYEWYVSYPINNYNVTLNIGKYAHRRETYVTDDTLTLDYYCLSYHAQPFRWVFDGVKPMLKTLEKQYGKYPFGRDGFTLMESLYPMEHQSAVSFGKLPATRADSLTVADTLRLMQLVWHEVSHEWWGNNVSCRDMADLWIHEAFATYSEGFYLQSAVDEDGELAYIASLPQQVIGKEPIVGVYDVNHIHYDIGDLYAKASLVLYTFRHALHNDTLWAAILKGIQQRFRYQTISTADLVNYINEQTRTNYTPFFDQYLNHTSIPTLLLKLTEKGRSLEVAYRWQADVPAFTMRIRVTKAKGKFAYVSPTTTWQTMTLPNLTADDFEVDELRFYVKVEEVE